MRFPFVLGCFLIVAACDESPHSKSNATHAVASGKEITLTFSPLVEKTLEEKKATIVMDRILQPGEEQPIPSVVGAGSLGYFVDHQFDSGEAGGFVRIHGSDGSSGGGSTGGEFSRQDGPVQASYCAVNTGKLPRRLMVYTTPAN